MTDETLKSLHLEGLMELLFQSTKDLLDVLENPKSDELEIRAKKKQLRALYETILEKRELQTRQLTRKGK
jgi:hypothetical protein